MWVTLWPTHWQPIPRKSPLVTPGSRQPGQPTSYPKMEVAMVVHFVHFLDKQVNITHNLVFGCRTTQGCPINASGDSWSRHKQVDVTTENKYTEIKNEYVAI